MSRECLHPTCMGEVCRRPKKEKKIYYLKRTPLKTTTNSRIGKTSPNNREELEKFFAVAALEIARSPYCMNCHTFISPQYYRHATAHILPKRLFRSIATHPLNYLILGASCCHGNYDSSWLKASKMKVWPQVVERFKQFYHLIPASEFRFIPQCLLNEVEPLDNFTFPTEL